MEGGTQKRKWEVSEDCLMPSLTKCWPRPEERSEFLEGHMNPEQFLELPALSVPLCQETTSQPFIL